MCKVSNMLASYPGPSQARRNLNRRLIECGFDGKDASVWLPTGFGTSNSLPFMFDKKLDSLSFMFDKKLGRDNSLVVVHCYLQHLRPMSAAHVCTSDKADRRITTDTILLTKKLNFKKGYSDCIKGLL